MNEASTYVIQWSDKRIIDYWFDFIVINLLKMKVFQIIIYDVSDFIYTQY